MKIDAETMRIVAGEATALLKGLANPHRLMIVCQLLEAPLSVGQLATFLGLRDSTVSQHLSLMRRDGLVSASRDGQTIWYSVKDPAARAVLQTLFALYCEPGTRSRSGKSPAGSKSKRSGR